MAHDYSVPNRMEPGGTRMVIGGSLDIESGGDLDIESGASIKIAGTAITPTAAQVNVLTGVTAGTVAASKAVVASADKDMGDFRNLDAQNIDAGASGVVGTIDVFPATLARGKATLAVTNQTGDTAVTLQVDAMGQATAVHFPDPGAAASYVAQSTAALTLAEVDVLDAVAAGTASANKAAVLGANKNLDEFHTAALYLGAAAGTLVTPTAAEVNVLAGAPAAATFVIGAEGGNVINVGIQLNDANGVALAVRGSLLAYLSADANGDAISGAAPDGGWAIGTDGLLIPVVASLCAQLVSEVDGDIDINITHAAGAQTHYLILVMPNGLLVASTAITFAA